MEGTSVDDGFEWTMPNRRNRVKFQRGLTPPPSTDGSTSSLDSDGDAILEPTCLRPRDINGVYRCTLKPGNDDNVTAPGLPIRYHRWGDKPCLADADLITSTEDSEVTTSDKSKVGDSTGDTKEPKTSRARGLEEWTCPNDESECLQCQAQRAEKPTTSTWDIAFLKDNASGWKCSTCFSQNPETASQCLSCDAEHFPSDKTPDKAEQSKKTSNGNPAGQTQPQKESNGVTGSIGSSSFRFGPSSAPKQPCAANATSSSSSFGSFGFGTATTKATTTGGKENRIPNSSGGFNFQSSTFGTWTSTDKTDKASGVPGFTFSSSASTPLSTLLSMAPTAAIATAKSSAPPSIPFGSPLSQYSTLKP